jgi:hypothetical protein
MSKGNVVGAHVRLTDEEGNIKFAIVPSCKTCNNTHNEYKLLWECKAVTIVSNSRLDFVGKVYLMEPDGKQSLEYWTKIDSISDVVGEEAAIVNATEEDGSRTRRRNPSRESTKAKNRAFAVEGTTNKNTGKRRCVYNDPDDFLLFLGILMRSKLTGRPMSLKNGMKFCPEIIDCNVNRFPRNREEYSDSKAQAKSCDDREDELEDKMASMAVEEVNPQSPSEAKDDGLEEKMERMSVVDSQGLTPLTASDLSDMRRLELQERCKERDIPITFPGSPSRAKKVVDLKQDLRDWLEAENEKKPSAKAPNKAPGNEAKKIKAAEAEAMPRTSQAYVPLVALEDVKGMAQMPLRDALGARNIPIRHAPSPTNLKGKLKSVAEMRNELTAWLQNNS